MFYFSTCHVEKVRLIIESHEYGFEIGVMFT